MARPVPTGRAFRSLPGGTCQGDRWGKTAAMSRYPKCATTVIGAHSVPDWYEALDRLVAVGQLGLAVMADAQ